jgi:hypothetical protein
MEPPHAMPKFQARSRRFFRFSEQSDRSETSNSLFMTPAIVAGDIRSVL